MRFFLPLLALLMAIGVGTAANNKTPDSTIPAASTSIVVTKSVAVNDTVLVVVGGSENIANPWTGCTVTDSGGNTYVKQVNRTASAAGFAVHEVWTCASATATATTVTAAVTGIDQGVAHSIAVDVMIYTGVAALGTISTTTGASNASSITGSITTQDANNYVVGLITIDNDGPDAGFGNTWATTPTSGTNRDLVHMISAIDANVAVIDKTSATPSSTAITCSASGAVSVDWVLTLIELRSTTDAAYRYRHARTLAPQQRMCA